MNFSQRGGWWVAAQLVLFAGVIFGGRLDVAHFSIDGAGPIGLAIAGAGIAIGVIAALQLRGALTPFPEPLAGAALVQSGLYRLVRHPIYTAVIITMAGVALRQENWVSVGFAAALLPFFWYKSRHEEERLAIAYPQYLEYMRAVRHRLIPGLL